MKAQVDAQALDDAIKIVKPAAGNAGVHGCVHLWAEDGELSLTCTNLVLTISTKIPATVGEPGVVLAGLSTILGAVAPISGPISLSDSPDSVLIEGGGAAVVINRPQSEDWPAIFGFDGDAVTISADRVWHLKKLLPFANPIASHPELAGIHLTGGHAMATDGNAMAVVRLPGAEFPGVTVPGPSLKAVLLAADGDVLCSADDRRASFTVGNTTWMTQLIGDKYPSEFLLSQVEVPDPEHLTVARDDLVTALAIAASVQPELAIRVTPHEDLLEFSSRSERGHASHAIPFEGTINWPFSIDPKYLKGILPAVRDDDVTLATTGPQKAIVVAEGDFTGIFMPIRER